MWAHIGACVSIITACLPTLAPLFTRSSSVETMLASIRSFLSLRTESSRAHLPHEHGTVPYEDSSTSSVKAKQEWHELNSRTQAGAARVLTRSSDEGPLVDSTPAIRVERSFGLHHGE